MDQLNNLISDTVRRSIIINGRLVTRDGQIVWVKRENYRPILFTLNSTKEEVPVYDDEALLDKYASDFNEVYKVVLPDNSQSEHMCLDFYGNIDTFAGAVVLRNGLYDLMCDDSNTEHLHDGTRQFNPEVQKIITKFVCYSIINYFEIYYRIFNRRLMGTHIPIKIRGHLVSGLFQPVVVETRYIKSPLTFGEFIWFHRILDYPEHSEIQLEADTDTSRALHLTVVSMYDLHTRFNVPCISELNRIYFMLVLLMILGSYIAPGFGKRLEGTFQRVFQSMDSTRGVPNAMGQVVPPKVFVKMFSAGVASARQQLIVR